VKERSDREKCYSGKDCRKPLIGSTATLQRPNSAQLRPVAEALLARTLLKTLPGGTSVLYHFGRCILHPPQCPEHDLPNGSTQFLVSIVLRHASSTRTRNPSRGTICIRSASKEHCKPLCTGSTAADCDLDRVDLYVSADNAPLRNFFAQQIDTMFVASSCQYALMHASRSPLAESTSSRYLTMPTDNSTASQREDGPYIGHSHAPRSSHCRNHAALPKQICHISSLSQLVDDLQHWCSL
jgi:hypothetical protein